MFQRDPRAGVFLGGDRVSGQDIRDQNGELYEHYRVYAELMYKSDKFSLHRRSQTLSKALLVL